MILSCEIRQCKSFSVVLFQNCFGYSGLFAFLFFKILLESAGVYMGHAHVWGGGAWGEEEREKWTLH